MNEESAGIDLAAEWDLVELPKEHLNSRPVDVRLEAGQVRIAIDVGGTLHLLVPVPVDRSIPNDMRSRGVVVLGQELELDDVRTRYIDLVCVDAALRPVFVRLASDVCERLSKPDADPVQTVQATVDEWRDLFRPGLEEVTATKAEGLFGELLVVLELARRNPILAIGPWVGPVGARHDFESPKIDLEIKTAVDHKTAVTIHGLDQLEPNPGRPLSLMLVNLRRNDHDGLAVTDLIEELLNLGVPRSELHRTLAGVGFQDTRPEPWQQHRWLHESSTLWEVGADFPGVRRSDIPDRRVRPVGRLSFELELSGCGDPLSDVEMAHVYDLLVEQ